MFAKKEWFVRRKYGGWGVTPNTWQGWTYIAIMMLILIGFQVLPFWTDETRILVLLVWLAVLLIDMVPIMISNKRDEREHRNEAIAERNAAWFMVLVLTAGILYDLIRSAMAQNLEINWFIAAALLGAAIIKSITNVVLERRGI